jgi:hypothetical protein
VLIIIAGGFFLRDRLPLLLIPVPGRCREND